MPIDNMKKLNFVHSPVSADWIPSKLLPLNREAGYKVGNAIPSGYDKYLRILHPVEGYGGQRLTWKQIASLNQKVLYPLTQFDELATTPGGEQLQERPIPGVLVDIALTPLINALSNTREDQNVDCMFAYWRGWGTLAANLQALTGLRTWTSESESSAHISISKREYVLLSGPIQALNRKFEGPGLRLTPQLWWPEDRRWFVSTDIDLEFTLIGADFSMASMLDEVLDLEVNEVKWEDRIDKLRMEIDGG